VIHVLVMGLPLAIGLAVAVLAARRNWAPRLPVALAVGAGLRLVILLIAARDAWQPYDLAEDFRSTADTVLGGRDPLVYVRYGGWHFLPFMAYVLAGQRELGLLLGVPWSVAGRIVPVLADVALIPLVGRLAGSRRELRAFQYACAPLGLLVSALHGQFAPLTLLFGVAALLAARGGRPHAAGMLAGFAVTSTSWTALLVPGVLLAAPAAPRARLTVLGWTAAIPAAFLLSGSLFLGTPLHRLPATVGEVLSARPVAGDWGWSAFLTGGDQVVSSGFGHIGTPLLALGLLAAGWWWRRADPVDLTLVLLVAFIVLSYRFGTQYLLWPVPYLIARSRRGTWPFITVASLWAAFGYLYMTRLDEFAWRDAHVWWALSSPLVIALLVWTLPGRRPQGGTAVRISDVAADTRAGP
jgi:hypothetical protein